MCIVPVSLLIFFLVINASHSQMGCAPLQFGFSVDTMSVITVTLNQTATVHCQYNCTSVNWDTCGIEANAIIIIPADNYSAHEVCYPSDKDRFNRRNYNITATCNTDSTCSSQYAQNIPSIATYTITLKGFNESSLREFVVVCGASRRNSVTEPFIRYSGLLHRRSIIKVTEQPTVKVISNEIDRHPAKRVQVGDNISITCAKTPGTISEWKLSILEQLDSIALYYSSVNLTQKVIINEEEEGAIDSATGLQNFSITLINVNINLTGAAIECGARWSEMSVAQTPFHDQAAVLIIHDSECKGCDKCPIPSVGQLNAAQVGGISTGVVIFVTLLVAAVVLVGLLGFHPVQHALNERQRRAIGPINGN